MVLLFPQLELENIGVCRLYLFVTFTLIEGDDVIAILFPFLLLFSLVVGNGLALVGIVQFAGVFYMHLGVAVYYAIP